MKLAWYKETTGEMTMEAKNLMPKHLLFFIVFISALFYVEDSGSDSWLFVVSRLFPGESTGAYDSWQYRNIGRTVATLLVSLPIALVFGSLLNRELRLGRLSLESRLRAWMIYIILAVTLFSFIQGLYGIVASYFDGTITTMGFLNNLYIVLLDGMILGYFGSDITRKTPNTLTLPMTLCSLGFITTVLATLGVVIATTDSPDHVRKMRHDSEVAGLFGNASESINTFTERKGHMPSSWADVARSDVPLSDKTPEYFEYKKTGDKTYELCATFHFDSEKTPREYRQAGQFYKKGRYCAPFQTK